MDLFESEINWLREELNKHNYNYYVLNKPTVSDKEYDDMMRRLQDLEAEHKELFDPLSPSQRVGSDLTAEFRTVKHRYAMLSLGNTYSLDELNEFTCNVARVLRYFRFKKHNIKMVHKYIPRKSIVFYIYNSIPSFCVFVNRKNVRKAEKYLQKALVFSPGI